VLLFFGLNVPMDEDEEKRLKDYASGFRFYSYEPLQGGEAWIDKIFNIELRSCGRSVGRTCYYVEGVEGSKAYEEAVDLAADLVTRFQDVRSFAKPCRKEDWNARHTELKKGVKGGRENRGPVMVYEGCAGQKGIRVMPPCYRYIGTLQDFKEYIHETHQYDWAKYKLANYHESEAQEQAALPEWKRNPEFRDNFKNRED